MPKKAKTKRKTKKMTKKHPETWDLSPLYKSDNDPQMKRDRLKNKKAYYRFINKWEKRSDYLKSPKVLKKALDEYEKLIFNHPRKEQKYFFFKSQQESNNPLIKAKIYKAEEFYDKIDNDIEFFTLNISKIPKGVQRKMLRSRELREYKHFLEKLFSWGEHTLSKKEEKILNLKSAVSNTNWARMTSGFLAKEERVVLNDKGKKEKKSLFEIFPLLSDRKKAVRKKAYKAINEILEKHSDVAEAEMNSILANKKINDELRGFERPDSSRHLGSDVDTHVVDVLIEAVSDNFKISREYFKLRAQILGLPKLREEERFEPLSKKKPEKFSYKKSVKIVNETLKDLDSEFSKIFMDFVKKGQIDVRPQKGKRGGAFCSYGHKKEPVYIFLNHNNKLGNVLTLAHEVGHGINGVIKKRKQNTLNVGDTITTAEVASTFMEDFVLEKIWGESSDEKRLNLMMFKLGDDTGSIFRQAAGYRFEQELHKSFREKGYLSKEEIGKIFRKHMSSYMGPYIEQSPGTENWWVHWLHFRMFFYVYSYASGLLMSKYLQAKVRKDPEYIEKVKIFLGKGGSDSPKNIMKELGIDITKKSFWQEGLKETENLLKEAKKLAKKLGKI